MTAIPDYQFPPGMADNLECPECVAEDPSVPAYAPDRHFNIGAYPYGNLYAGCDRHWVYWYVTRCLGGAPTVADVDGRVEVDGILRMGGQRLMPRRIPA